ncbi:unnamed protein product [Arabidopsis lyrata]|nr:unnamed protein product [Arabidopsis lyrata]
MKVLVCPRELELKYKKVPGLSSFGRAKGRSHAGAHDPRGGLANVLRSALSQFSMGKSKNFVCYFSLGKREPEDDVDTKVNLKKRKKDVIAAVQKEKALNLFRI